MKTEAVSGSRGGFTLWLTGLPCSGKTTLAQELHRQLLALGYASENLDGDVLRQNLCKDLGFTKEDRMANIARTAFVASALTRNGVAVIVSFVSPYREMRERARVSTQPFIETYVRCPLEECERRDVKGMYKLARKGEIKNFTGVTDPYEEPLAAEITVDTEKHDLAFCAEQILAYLETKNFIVRNPFSSRPALQKAFALAARHHAGQKRKGGLPYITHPIAVARLLEGAGYGDAVLAAALLHDVLEDSGCELEEMEKAVGTAVTGIVIEVTEKDKTVPWSARKESYLAGLRAASPEGLAVACADKIHNIESLVEGGRAAGADFFRTFSGGLAGKIENYRNIYEAIASRDPGGKLLERYRRSLEGLKVLAAEKGSGLADGQKELLRNDVRPVHDKR